MIDFKRFKDGFIRQWSNITITTILAGIFGSFVFVYKDIYLPYSQVSFFTTSIEVEQKNDICNESQECITPIIVKVSGKNNSTKFLSIASGFIKLNGEHVESIEKNDTSNFLKTIPEDLNKSKTDSIAIGKFNVSGKYLPINNNSKETLYIFPIFKDWGFEPGEMNIDQRIVYLPKGKFNVIELKAVVLFGPNAHDVDLRHSVKLKDNDIDVLYLTKDPTGPKGEAIFGDDKSKSEYFIKLMRNYKISKSTSISFVVLK